MDKQYQRVKYACYTSNLSMSVVGNISPVLFITFRNMYGISYTLLGLLVLVNFVTQLTVDLVFSFFSHKFNIPKCVKMIPVLTVIGLLIYALFPALVPDMAYIGLVIGTVVFAAAGGFVEVLISPVIAAIPSKDPDREMSKLHSIYAWGVVGVIIISTLFLQVFGNKYWFLLALLFSVVPLVSMILFSGAKIPKMQTPEKTSGAVRYLKDRGVWMCVLAIFFGGAAECTMAQWSSGYLETALSVPKVYGDIFGVALFSLMLGLGRTLYSKFGKNIEKVLLFGAIGATLCYVVAAISNIHVIGLIFCAFTGFCTSMLWPGNLIVATDRYSDGGVFMFALMASGGDLGASVGPQLVGVVTDTVIANEKISAFAASLSMTPESLGMKLGMLVGALFPLCAVFIFLKFIKNKKTTD